MHGDKETIDFEMKSLQLEMSSLPERAMASKQANISSSTTAFDTFSSTPPTPPEVVLSPQSFTGHPEFSAEKKHETMDHNFRKFLTGLRQGQKSRQKSISDLIKYITIFKLEFTSY